MFLVSSPHLLEKVANPSDPWSYRQLFEPLPTGVGTRDTIQRGILAHLVLDRPQNKLIPESPPESALLTIGFSSFTVA
jgi:hypothetical protein